MQLSEYTLKNVVKRWIRKTPEVKLKKKKEKKFKKYQKSKELLAQFLFGSSKTGD